MHETKSKMYAWNCVVPWHHTCSGYATVRDIPYAYGTSHTRMGQYTHMGQNSFMPNGAC